jgi:hypothetical protein
MKQSKSTPKPVLTKVKVLNKQQISSHQMKQIRNQSTARVSFGKLVEGYL